MKMVDFLAHLHSLDIEVIIDGEQLRVNAPQGALTSELRAELGERKAELLTFLHQANLKNDISQQPISPISREGDLPLSFAQERLWFLDQLEPGNTSYNMAWGYYLRGELDVAALEQSFNQIIARHESLRTTFATVKGQPVQRIAPKLKVALPVVDLRTLAEGEREERVQEYMVKERRRAFELEQGLLIRTSLLHLDDEAYVLLLSMHHIISDAWSLGVLFGELATLYEANRSGKEASLPELPIQYADYTMWQREWLQGEVLKEQLDYWKKQLEGVPPTLELPTDRPRPAVQTFRGMSQTIALSKTLSGQLKRLSQQEGATLFMTLLAAFNVLLYRYTGQEDIVVGVPIANRNRSEIEPLIGFFINTLVLRTELSDNPTFREILGRVREEAMGAYEYQDLPFEKLVEELHPQRDRSRTPLFQVFFNMLNQDRNQLELPGVSIEPISQSETDSKFDLTLYAREQKDEGIHFQLLYNADLFEPITISQILEHYQTLLEGIVVDLEQAISRLPRPQLKGQSNGVKPTNPFIKFEKEEIEQSITARFEKIVQKHPQNIAIKTDQCEWSYEALNQLSNQIGQTILNACGAGEERVALLFEHGAPMIAAMLGVLKSGKSYVPLDTSYPQERLVYILEDAEAGTIVTNQLNQRLAQKLSQTTRHLINIDELEEMTLSREPLKAVSPNSLAYLLYTSGSTGHPKGVVQNHRNVLSHIRNYTNNLHINANDRLTLLSAYSFDAAVMGIYGALLNGATLCPLDIKQEGISNLSQWLIERGITIYHSTPTVYRYFINSLSGQEDFSQIRFVVLGGEEVYKRDVELYKKHFSPECIFVNGLGPTESTVSLQYFINHETRINRDSVPVGYPVEGTEILLLNKAGEETGIYGEIAIKSAHIALGYWRRPALTEAAFLPDPEGGDRCIYRTGDMGRLLADGRLEFMGRKDFQVKSRGYRIELGEIKAVLEQHPRVKECVVMAQEAELGEKRLVAILVMDHQEMTSGELRNYLRRKLPEYMIPSAFIKVEQLPLTPNGKLDREALPAAEVIEPQKAYIAPQDELEWQLTKIWENVLKVRPIGVRDGFFELGGHSLLAVRLFAQLEKVFGKNLPLATLFQAPTIEQLAEIVRDEGWRAPWASLVPIQPQGMKPPFFCVHAVGGNVLSLRDLAQYLGADQPFYALQSQGLDGKKIPPRRVEEMAAYYIEEMRTVQPEGPYYLGGQSSGGLIALEMAQQLRTQGEQVAILALIDTYDPSSRGLPATMSFRDRLSFHLGTVIQLGPSYLLEWTKYRLKKARFLFERGGAEIVKRMYVGLEKPLPQSIRYTYVREIIRQAVKDYTPKSYEGRITLFRATNTIQAYLENLEGAQQRWGRLAIEGLDTYDIDGAHNLEQEPYIGVLAEKLSACICKAQVTVSQQKVTIDSLD